MLQFDKTNPQGGSLFEAEKIKTGRGMSNCRNQSSTVVMCLGGLVGWALPW